MSDYVLTHSAGNTDLLWGVSFSVVVVLEGLICCFLRGVSATDLRLLTETPFTFLDQ